MYTKIIITKTYLNIKQFNKKYTLIYIYYNIQICKNVYIYIV